SDLYVNKEVWLFIWLGEQKIVRPMRVKTLFQSGRLMVREWRSVPTDRGRSKFTSARAGRSRDVTPITSGPLDVPSSWTTDGKEIIFTRGFRSEERRVGKEC